MGNIFTRGKHLFLKNNHICAAITLAILVLFPALLVANPENPKNRILPKTKIKSQTTWKEIKNADSGNEKLLSSSYFEKILSVYEKEINKIYSATVKHTSVWLPFNCSSSIISNPDFESGFSDWDFFANSNISNDAYYGNNAVVTSGGAGGIGRNIVAYENEVYSLEAYAKKSGTEEVVVGIKFLDAGFNEIEANYVWVEGNVYTAYYISAKAPEGTAFVQPMGWKHDGTGTATFDGYCFEKWTLPYTSCSGESCELTPSYQNYIWAMDDSGNGSNWKDYDTGGLTLCDNGNGTMSILGSIINGEDATWNADHIGIPCGSQDGWFLNLTLSDRQSWTEFQGTYVQKVGCGANHVDWDYWQIAGTLTGLGCNAGRTIDIHSSSAGYRAQVGWGGNSNSCDFGISTWMAASENGQPVGADLYAHMDADCYEDLDPENCVDGVDNDGDGLTDCYDPDCAPQILQNYSFENTGGITFNTTFQGSPAYALPNNSTVIPNWRMEYGCSGTCYDSYWIDDSANIVNNPAGDYFLWMPGAYYCARQSITVSSDKCYEVTLVAAAFSDPSPQSQSTIEVEMFGGGIDDNGGLLSVYKHELPASPSWSELNWETLTFTWSPAISTATNIYISQNNSSTTAKGIAIDQVLVKEICCPSTSNPPLFTCADGKDIDLEFVGIHNDLPKTLNINDQSNIDSIVVEIVYEDVHPGSSIVVTNAGGTNYTAYQQQISSDGYYYKAVLPPTSSITYSNTINQHKAQSMSALVFRNNSPGKAISTVFSTLSGHANTKQLVFPIPEDYTKRNIKLTLPISEITYDDRRLELNLTAGSLSKSVTKVWGPSGEGFPNGCCIDTVEFFLQNVEPDVNTITIDIVSPGGGQGQSYVIGATVEVEIFCDEICGNGLDDDGDGLVDNEDDDCLCPDIYPVEETNITICEGDDITFDVLSNAPNPPYSYIEFYRFETQQTNPYISNDPKLWLGEFANVNNGAGSITNSNFPNNGNSNMTYYVYGCVKPEPQDPTTCAPLVEYIVTVKPGTTIAASADATICSNVGTSINASASGGPTPYIFSWDNGLGNGASKSITPSSTTTYHVTVSNDVGCTDEGEVLVTVNEAPIANAGDPESACITDDTNLNATATGGTAPYTFNWNNGLGSGASKTVSPNLTTTYEVTVISDNGCIDSDDVTITVENCVEICTDGVDNDGDGKIDCFDEDCIPFPTTSGDVTICIGSSTDLSVDVPNGNGTYEYTWSNGLGMGKNKTVNPLTTTTYTVTVANVAGCVGTTDVTVTVNNCPEVCADGIDNDGNGLTDCEDPACYAVGAPSLVPDEFTICPSATLIDRVDLNDGNLQTPIYSVFTYPSSGTLNMDASGKFIYTPFSSDCGPDVFIYNVCNQVTGCCATAAALITIGDTIPPILEDVPADITISCDEVVPDPNMVLAFDNCPGIFADYDENSDEYTNGNCEGHTITRIWSAEDLCGNRTDTTQIITVEDLEAPELFRVYTLPNGKKAMAGVSQRGNTNWKYIAFPTTFSITPMVFSQVISNNDGAAVITQHRNVTPSGFEVKLSEEEVSTSNHAPEQVAWMAIEPDDQIGIFEAGLASLNTTLSTLNFGQTFPNHPHLFFSTQTVNETDPYSIRIENVTNGSVDVLLEEETSNDAEITHTDEAVAYMAIASGKILKDEEGDFIAETGKVNVSNAWATVNLENSFSKPVVLMGGISKNDPENVTVRVRNVTATSFQVRLQEWNYQDGTHNVETVSYIVLEGGLPDDISTYCSFEELKLQPGVNVFVRDNCDSHISLEYNEMSNMMPDGLQVIREWTAVDNCGNDLTFSRADDCRVASIKLNALLYGAIMDDVSDPLMSDELRNGDYLPMKEPYTDLPFIEQIGEGGGETVDQSLYDVTGEHAIVDWLMLEIRDSINANEVLATKSVLLKRNGEVISANGEEVLYFPNLREGSYNVAFRHRNHLGIAAGHTWYLSSINVPKLDFSDVNVAVVEKGESSTVVNGKRAAWAGDFNGDRKIIYQGPQNDVFTLFSKVLSDEGNVAFLANFISYGYDRTDMDMDGRIIYQGPDNERAKLLYFTILSHPSNTGFLANYIVEEKLP